MNRLASIVLVAVFLVFSCCCCYLVYQRLKSEDLNMPVTIEVVESSPKSNIGTRPHWDEGAQSLYYSDIYGTEASILRYDVKEDKVYSAIVDQEPVVSFIIPVANQTDKFAVGIGRRVGIIQWDGKSPKATVDSIAFEVETGQNTTRFNDAKADPFGRFYGGTMRLEALGSLYEIAAGTFYKYTKEEGAKDLLHDIYISNGLTWDTKGNKFYYIDSCKIDVKEYDYDPESGNISNQRVLIDFMKDGKNPGFIPDGMTIDTDQNLYVATWGGSKIYKIDPKQGKVISEIQLPVRQVTSMVFAGPNLDTFYVTTAATDRDGEQPPLSGHLFKITGLGATGYGGVKVNL